MAIKFADSTRNARANATETDVGASPILRGRTGAPPANVAASDTGTVLFEMTLPADWMADAAAGVKTILGLWQDLAGNAAGDCGHFRIYTSGGAAKIQGTVTATGGGGDMTLDNINIAVGQAVTVTAFTLTEGNAQLVAITTRDGLAAACAAAQPIRHWKSASRTAVAGIPFSVFDLAGSPGAGVLAGTNTANGVVPTDATAGCPAIDGFTGGNLGYVTRFELTSPVACRVAVYDMLFKAGAYVFNANVTLASQPAFTGRIPANDKRCEIWLEAVTAFTGNQSIRVTYLDQDGNAGDTGVIATGVAPIVGRMFRMPLAVGDYGAQRIDSVISSVSTVGTFNVLVLRKLAEARIRLAQDHVVHGFDLTGLRRVFDNSALVLVVTADSTATSTPEANMDVANG